MTEHLAIRVLAALMAVWAAWNLGTLARDLRLADAISQSLDQAIAEIEGELATQPSDPDDILEWAKGAGYVYRGDMVFFDGG